MILHSIWLWMRRGTIPAFFLLLTMSAFARTHNSQVSVPLCRGVTLSASYLSQTGDGEGPGFQFSLTNSTSRTVKLAEPVPSSSHWYALTHGKWLWRASNGAGGSLLDASNEKGRVFVYPVASGKTPDKSFTVAPHRTRTWVSDERENHVLEYKPGCPICSYPGESEYRVIFAYAYLPTEKEAKEGWLTCGIRSEPVPMPPKR